MLTDSAAKLYRDELAEIEQAGLFKRERVISSPQSAHIEVNGKRVLNFCANNYLGLANDETLRKAAHQGLDEFGLGLASVRFICGTQTVHKQLEERIARFFRTEDTILYASCFDANGGLFETLLKEKDAIVSDSLNHASIIDGIRLCKAQRFVYEHNNIDDLRTKLAAARAAGAQRIMISTDGVFSMDGDVAKLQEISALADEFGAMLHVDDCHGTGFFGPTGRGSVEHCGLLGKVDVITSTLGKALGGSVGGFTTGHRDLIALLRQRSRPYLFSNSLPPALVVASIACLELIDTRPELLRRIRANTELFRTEMTRAGFQIRPGIHPIAPLMLGEARLASEMAERMLAEGVYVIGFSFPVVPKGQARIRVQLSAAHSEDDVRFAITAFTKVGKQLGVC